MSEARILEIEDDETAGASPAHEEEPRQEISYEDMQKLVRSAEEKAARERIRAERAEQEAARNRDSAVSEAEARYNAEVQGIEAGISGADAEVKALKAEYARQLEAADWNGAADTQVRLAESAARLTNLRATKEYLSANKDILLAQAKRPQPAQPQATQGGYTARELAWIAEHPQYHTDPDFQDKVMIAHRKAMRQGIARDTDEYFALINEAVGNGQAGSVQMPPPKRQSAASAPAAPVSRRAPNGSAAPGQLVAQLNRDERDMAERMYSGKVNPDTGKQYTQTEMYLRYARNKETIAKRGLN